MQSLSRVTCKAPTSGLGEGAGEEEGGGLVSLIFGVGWRSGGGRRPVETDVGAASESAQMQSLSEVAVKAPTSGRGEGAGEEEGGRLDSLIFGVGWRSGGGRRPVRMDVGAPCELC